MSYKYTIAYIFNMISLQVLQNNISKCPMNTKLSMPDQSKEFVQNTAYDFKIKQLKHSNGSSKLLSQIPDYTMQKEIDKLQDNIDNNEMDEQSINENYVPNKSLILITENSTIELPETILDLFGLTGICQEDYYIYGVRNPDSFYNSILLQLKNSFILGKKNGRRNDVSTFKNEIVIKFDAFYKKLEYKKYGVVRAKFLSKVLNDDNYVNYDILLYLADYLQINLMVIDIVDMNYCYVKYQPTNLSSFNQTDSSRQEIGFESYNLDHDTDKCLVIIKYESDTYLPIMCKTGNHFVSSNILQILTEQGYGPIYPENDKVRKSVSVNDEATSNNTAIIDIVSNHKADELAALDKVLDQVKANKVAKEKAKQDKRDKNLKPKPKKKVELPVEGDSSSEEELEKVEPANILSEDFIKTHLPMAVKSTLAKVKLDLLQNTATYYGVEIFKDSNGKQVKKSKIILAHEIYRAYEQKYIRDLLTGKHANDKKYNDKYNKK